jgi:uncharacterized cupin superfamily protein
MINLTNEPCRYLCFSTLGFPEIAVYPDSKKVGLLGPRERRRERRPTRAGLALR